MILTAGQASSATRRTVPATVTSVLHTSAGRMVFGKFTHESEAKIEAAGAGAGEQPVG